jgi:Ca-activated chloride channel homolog
VSFGYPAVLVLLVLPVAMMVAYRHAQRRRRRDGVRFADAALLDELLVQPSPRWRRVLPPAATVIAVVLLIVAGADPRIERDVSDPSRTVVLALDVSKSMEATDVAPTRWEAAKVAALDFVNAAPPGARVGLVSFAGSAQPVVTPTADKERLRRAIVNLQLAPGTAIGEAVFTSLGMLETAGWDNDDPEQPAIQRRAGAIVVMSDGATNTGRPDADASLAAALSGVAVHTVAFGTADGVFFSPEGPIPVPAEPGALAAVAEATDGRTFTAESGDELSRVFIDLSSSLTTDRRPVSVASFVALLAALLLVVAGLGWSLLSSRLD